MVLTYGEARGVWIGLSQQCQAIPYIVQSEWEGLLHPLEENTVAD